MTPTSDEALDAHLRAALAELSDPVAGRSV